MPFDSNGTFNRVIPGGWKADAAANIKIRADRHDDEDDGFATGLSTCITKDGRTQPTANIPLNNKKLINVGEPTNPSDVATKNYVDNFKSFTTGANISGAGPINGFINFTSPVGINGIGWSTADMSWVGKLEEVNKTSKRLTVNNAKDGTGTDVAVVDETGRFNNSGHVSNNLSWENSGWRTIGLGTGTMVRYVGGAVSFHSNDVATTVDYQSATLREYFTATNNNGSTALRLDKSASGKDNTIHGTTAGSARWTMYLGNSTAETSTRTGSDFYILSYSNAGDAAFYDLRIARDTHEWTVGGPVCGAGEVRVRPYANNVTTQDVMIDSVGSLSICNRGNGAVTGGVYAGCGLMGRAGGYQGNYDGYWHNLYYNGGFEYVYVNATLMGAITWQSDYRIKKNIKPLPSMWDRVKSLKPIKYEHRDYKDLIKADGIERWGMLAHELQERLLPAACIGNKDEENVIQSVNPLVMITVLTKALQEAMTRIEALEARA